MFSVHYNPSSARLLPSSVSHKLFIGPAADKFRERPGLDFFSVTVESQNLDEVAIHCGITYNLKGRQIFGSPLISVLHDLMLVSKETLSEYVKRLCCIEYLQKFIQQLPSTSLVFIKYPHEGKTSETSVTIRCLKSLPSLIDYSRGEKMVSFLYSPIAKMPSNDFMREFERHSKTKTGWTPHLRAVRREETSEEEALLRQRGYRTALTLVEMLGLDERL